MEVRKVKEGEIMRYTKGFFGGKWKSANAVLFSDSTFSIFEEKGDRKPKASIFLKDYVPYICVGLVCDRMPVKRPQLPTGFSVHHLVAIGMDPRAETVHWVLFANDADIQSWFAEITKTLPQPASPPSQPQPTNVPQAGGYVPPPKYPDAPPPVQAPGAYPAAPPAYPAASGGYQPQPAGYQPQQPYYPPRQPTGYGGYQGGGGQSGSTVVVVDRGGYGGGGGGSSGFGSAIGGFGTGMLLGSLTGYGMGSFFGGHGSYGSFGGFGGGHGYGGGGSYYSDNDTTTINNYYGGSGPDNTGNTQPAIDSSHGTGEPVGDATNYGDYEEAAREDGENVEGLGDETEEPEELEEEPTHEDGENIEGLGDETEEPEEFEGGNYDSGAGGYDGEDYGGGDFGGGDFGGDDFGGGDYGGGDFGGGDF